MKPQPFSPAKIKKKNSFVLLTIFNDYLFMSNDLDRNVFSHFAVIHCYWLFLFSLIRSNFSILIRVPLEPCSFSPGGK